jgi:polar amino acid transport system substrate-binding protein
VQRRSPARFIQRFASRMYDLFHCARAPILSATLLLLVFAFPVRSQTTELRVVAVGSEPFVIDDDGGTPAGLSVDVWSAVATGLGIESRFVPVSEVGSALEMVEAGEADVAIGPISITAERAERVQFTQPYFHASLGILAPAAGSLFDRFAPFLSQTFAVGVVALIAVLALVGTLLWLAERRVNSQQFPENGLEGIGNGLWMALVTMTTVGYGDRVPVSPLGRVLTGIWMLVSLVIASSLTAFLATALTLSQLDAPTIGIAEELRGRRVGVVTGTTSVAFVEGYGGRGIPVPDVGEAVAALAQGQTDAVVFDRPILRYTLSESPELALSLAEASYQPQNYGFALPFGSDLTREIDVTLLGLQESGALLEIEERWLGASP